MFNLGDRVKCIDYEDKNHKHLVLDRVGTVVSFFTYVQVQLDETEYFKSIHWSFEECEIELLEKETAEKRIEKILRESKAVTTAINFGVPQDEQETFYRAVAKEIEQGVNV